MTVFHADLDNTLIYSHRHNIGENKACVEIYEGREVSFMTRRSQRLLREVRERTVFVPTTTRTKEQYQRIDFGADTPEYALVCNGGVLLVDGKEDADWYKESLRLTEGCRGELEAAARCLEEDRERILEVRNVRDLFLFTKSAAPDRTIQRLSELVRPVRAELFCNGAKIYVLPKELDKGTAVRRFRNYVLPETAIAAGDSEFDIPMLMEADIAVAPGSLAGAWERKNHVARVDGQRVFSDAMLEYVLSVLH